MSIQLPAEASFPPSPNPTIVRPIHNFLHLFQSSPSTASCWVTIFKNLSRYVVLITAREESEHSLTDHFHEIATQIKDSHLPGVAPERISWVEHHKDAVSLGRPKPHPTLDLPDIPYTAKVGGWQFHPPRSWTRITRDHFESLAGGLVEL